jgi:hypothetical protein
VLTPARVQRNLPVLSLFNINYFQIMINHKNSRRCCPLLIKLSYQKYLPSQW